MHSYAFRFIWMDGLSDRPPRWCSVRIWRTLSPSHPVSSTLGFQASIFVREVLQGWGYTSASPHRLKGGASASELPRVWVTQSRYTRASWLPHCGERTSLVPCCGKSHKSRLFSCGETTSLIHLIAGNTTTFGQLVAAKPQVWFILRR